MLEYLTLFDYVIIIDSQQSSFFHYVQMIGTLKVLLRNESVLMQVMTAKETRSNIISDFRDSASFKFNPVFQWYGYCFEINVYSDEHHWRTSQEAQDISIYYTFGNLNRGSRSKCPTIQLFCLCKASDVNEFGLDAVVRCLKKNCLCWKMKALMLVCLISCLGLWSQYEVTTWIATALVVLNESFGPNVFRPCHFCMVTRNNVKMCTEVSKLQCCTKQSYRHHVSVVKADERQFLLYRVKRDSPF